MIAGHAGGVFFADAAWPPSSVVMVAGLIATTTGPAAEDAFSLYGNVAAGATFTDVRSFEGTRGFDVVKGVAFTFGWCAIGSQAAAA